MGASNRIQDLDQALLAPGPLRPPDARAAAGPRRGASAILERAHARQAARAGRRPRADRAADERAHRAPSSRTSATRPRSSPAAATTRYLTQADFDAALERVVAGLQQKKVLTEKERRILAYHEGGHALMAHLMGAAMELQKVTIVSRGEALGYAFYLPEEDRYLHTKEELDRPDDRRARRPRRRGGRLRPRHERRRERPREGHGDRPLDGLRVGHGGQRLVADAARRQLRALGGDEAPARPGAGAADRRRLRRGASACSRSIARRSTGSPRRCSRGRRSSATRWSSCSPTSSRSRARPSRSACRRSSPLAQPRSGRPATASTPAVASAAWGARNPPRRRRRRGPRRGGARRTSGCFGATARASRARRGAGRRGGVDAASATAASSCSRRSATTRRSGGSSRGAARACTTSRTRWTTSAPRSPDLTAAGRRADRRGAAPGHVRARGRVRPPGIGSRRPLGGGVAWLTASASGSRSASRAAR